MSQKKLGDYFRKRSRAEASPPQQSLREGTDQEILSEEQESMMADVLEPEGSSDDVEPSENSPACSPLSSYTMSPPPHIPSVSLSSPSAGTSDISSIDYSTADDVGLMLHSVSQSELYNLSPECKYNISKNHFRPDIGYKFPSRYLDGCNRSCQFKYFAENPGFVYSKSEDGIFCLPCVLFASNPNLGQFVTKKFNTWSKKTRKFKEHNSCEYHKLSLVRMEALQSSMTHQEVSLPNRLRRIEAAEIQANRYIIKCMADAILLCGKQCLALRGHRDDGTADEAKFNKGNFLALLGYSVRSGNSALEKHLTEGARNAVYTSKTIQNEIIQCIGDHLRDIVLNEIKLAKWFSVLCDEVTDISTKEQLSLVIRFVDSNCDIREEFLDFILTDRITGEVVARKIKEALVKYGLEFKNCRGQGYDGGSNMSAPGGVQGLLLAENPKATYMHCNAHILNLCIVSACSLPAIRNMNSTVTESANFFENSSKRQTFLEKVLDNETTTVKVKDLCRTRWAYRHEAYSNFYTLYKYLVSVMELITTRSDQFGDMNWDANTIILANGLLKMYTSFSFVVSFISTMNAMTIIKPISIKLQFRYYDIVKAYKEVSSVIDELKALRASDSMLHSLYEQAVKFAEEIDVTPCVPRTTGRQRHRDNTEYNSVEEYYRRCVLIPLLDNLVQQMEERFGNTKVLASKLLCLVPSELSEASDESFEGVVSLYGGDLPSPEVVQLEIWRWRSKWDECAPTERPSTLQTALKACDKEFYPNIHTLLCIACTLPVTSCENERAHSTLKNIKTFLRSTMGEERLSSLALMHIYYHTTVDFDDIIDRFKLMHKRRMPL